MTAVVRAVALPPFERLHLVKATFIGTMEYDDAKKALQARADQPHAAR
jgi:hypothetical protein